MATSTVAPQINDSNKWYSPDYICSSTTFGYIGKTSSESVGYYTNLFSSAVIGCATNLSFPLTITPVGSNDYQAGPCSASSTVAGQSSYVKVYFGSTLVYDTNMGGSSGRSTTINAAYTGGNISIVSYISGSADYTYFGYKITLGNLTLTYNNDATQTPAFSTDPSVAGSTSTSQTWAKPNNSVALSCASSNLTCPSATVSCSWKVYRGATLLTTQSGFTVTSTSFIKAGTYTVRATLSSTQNTNTTYKEVTVTITALSETKTIAGDAVTNNTTISKKTGTTTSYTIAYNTTFLEKVARQIFVNGVAVASATSTSNLTYSLTISSNTTATIQFVATNIYDSSDVYETTNYLDVDGILQGTGSILYNGQPITSITGRVPQYTNMAITMSGITGYDENATYSWSATNPTGCEITDETIGSCTFTPFDITQTYVLTYSITSYGITKTVTFDAGVAISCYKGVITSFTLDRYEGSTTDEFTTINASYVPNEDPQPTITSVWKIYDSGGIEVPSSDITIISGSMTSENFVFSMNIPGTFTVTLVSSSSGYEDGTYSRTVQIGLVVDVSLGAVSRYSIALDNGGVVAILNRRSITQFSGLVYMKSLNQTGSATFRVIGANNLTKVVGSETVSATSDLMRVGTRVTIIDNMVPIWMGVISTCTEVNQNFFSNIVTTRVFELECDESIKQLSFDYVPLLNTGTVNGTIPEIVSKIIDSSNIGVVSDSLVNYAISIETASRLAALDSLSNQLGWRYRCRPSITSYYKRISVTPIQKRVTLSLPTEYSDCDIRYTTDGSTPTGTSTLYETPFLVAPDTVITSLAFRNVSESSDDVTITRYVTAEPYSTLPSNIKAYYTTDNTRPIAQPAKEYTPGDTIAIALSNQMNLLYYDWNSFGSTTWNTSFSNEIYMYGPSGYTIYYTLDGTTPTESSTEYTAAFQTAGSTVMLPYIDAFNLPCLSNTVDVRAIAYLNDYISYDVVISSIEYLGVTSYALPESSGALSGDIIVMYDTVGQSYAIGIIDTISTTGGYDVITFASYFGTADFLRSADGELTNSVYASTYNTYLIDYKPTYYQEYIPVMYKVNQYAQNVTDLSSSKDKYGEVSVFGVGYSGEHIASNMRAWMIVNPDYTISKSARIRTSYDSTMDSISKIDTVVGKATPSKSFGRFNLVLNGWSFPTTINSNYVPTVFYSNLYESSGTSYRHLRKIELTYDSDECPDLTSNPRFFYDQNNNKKTAYTISVDLDDTNVDGDGVHLSNVISSFIPMTNVVFNRMVLAGADGRDGTYWLPAVDEAIRIGDMHATVNTKNATLETLIFNWDVPSVDKVNGVDIPWDDTDTPTPHGHMTDVLVMDDSMTVITEGNYESPVPSSPKYNYPTINQTVLGPEGYSLMELERLACRYMQYGSNYSDRGSCKIPLPVFRRQDYSIGGYRIPMVGDRIAFQKANVNNATTDADYTLQNYELQSYKVDTDKMVCEVKYGMPFVMLGDVLYNMLSNSGMSILPSDSEDNV